MQLIYARQHTCNSVYSIIWLVFSSNCDYTLYWPTNRISEIALKWLLHITAIHIVHLFHFYNFELISMVEIHQINSVASFVLRSLFVINLNSSYVDQNGFKAQVVWIVNYENGIEMLWYLQQLTNIFDICFTRVFGIFASIWKFRRSLKLFHV